MVTKYEGVETFKKNVFTFDCEGVIYEIIEENGSDGINYTYTEDGIEVDEKDVPQEIINEFERLCDTGELFD